MPHTVESLQVDTVVAMLKPFERHPQDFGSVVAEVHPMHDPDSDLYVLAISNPHTGQFSVAPDHIEAIAEFVDGHLEVDFPSKAPVDLPNSDELLGFIKTTARRLKDEQDTAAIEVVIPFDERIAPLAEQIGFVALAHIDTHDEVFVRAA